MKRITTQDRIADLRQSNNSLSDTNKRLRTVEIQLQGEVNDLSAQLHRAESERDALADATTQQIIADFDNAPDDGAFDSPHPICTLALRNDHYRAERDALAAHVEQLQKAAEKLESANNQHEFNRAANQLLIQVQELPSVGLAEYDANVARAAILAALEDYRNHYVGQGISEMLESFSDIYANRLREQPNNAKS